MQFKSTIKTLTQGLLLSGLLTGFASQSLAAAKQEFGNPQHIPVERYAKKMLAAPLQGKIDPLKKNDGRDALIILPWEIDDRGVVEKLDVHGKGTRKMVKAGKGGLIAVRLVDEEATKRTKRLIFQAPQYLEFGDSRSWCWQCEWENDVAVGDMDNDGFLDIVALNAFTKTITIFYNDGTGHFDHPNAKTQKLLLSNIGIGIGLGGGSGSAPAPHPHPFQLAVADFNQDAKNDIAVLGTPGNYCGSMIVDILFGNKLNGEYGAPGTSSIPVEFFAGIPCLHDSPYYTLTPTEKSFYLLFTQENQLFVRTNSDQIMRWGRDISQPPSQVFSGVAGSFGLAHNRSANPADLLVANGGGQMRDLNTGRVTANGASTIPGFFGEAFVTGDFDLDEQEDFATVLVGNRETQKVGALRVGFGTPIAANAFQTPTQVTRATEAILPWKGNPVQMIAGNFFDTRDKNNGQVFQDIAVLGTDWVTVWPNANRACDFGRPALQDINPRSVTAGDKITLRGQFGIGSNDAINEINLQSPMLPPIIFNAPFANSIAGNPDVITVEVPADATPGDYDVSVQNACFQSLTVLRLTVKAAN